MTSEMDVNIRRKPTGEIRSPHPDFKSEWTNDLGHMFVKLCFGGVCVTTFIPERKDYQTDYERLEQVSAATHKAYKYFEYWFQQTCPEYFKEKSTVHKELEN